MTDKKPRKKRNNALRHKGVKYIPVEKIASLIANTKDFRHEANISTIPSNDVPTVHNTQYKSDIIIDAGRANYSKRMYHKWVFEQIIRHLYLRVDWWQYPMLDSQDSTNSTLFSPHLVRFVKIGKKRNIYIGRYSKDAKDPFKACYSVDLLKYYNTVFKAGIAHRDIQYTTSFISPLNQKWIYHKKKSKEGIEFRKTIKQKMDGRSKTLLEEYTDNNEIVVHNDHIYAVITRMIYLSITNRKYWDILDEFNLPSRSVLRTIVQHLLRILREECEKHPGLKLLVDIATTSEERLEVEHPAPYLSKFPKDISSESWVWKWDRLANGYKCICLGRGSHQQPISIQVDLYGHYLVYALNDVIEHNWLKFMHPAL